jgi:uncharacterized protein (DUF2141 family)
MDIGHNRLVIRVDGLRSDRGHVIAALYDGPVGFPDGAGAAVQSAHCPIQGTKADVAFEALTPGLYAVALLHDENDNGKMDRNRLGVPIEGFGVSGYERPGIPRFDRAAFRYQGGQQTIRIRMNYLL